MPGGLSIGGGGQTPRNMLRCVVWFMTPASARGLTSFIGVVGMSCGVGKRPGASEAVGASVGLGRKWGVGTCVGVGTWFTFDFLAFEACLEAFTAFGLLAPEAGSGSSALSVDTFIRWLFACLCRSGDGGSMVSRFDCTGVSLSRKKRHSQRVYCKWQ